MCLRDREAGAVAISGDIDKCPHKTEPYRINEQESLRLRTQMRVESQRDRATQRVADEQVDISTSNSWEYVGNEVFNLIAIAPRRHPMAEKIGSDHIITWKISGYIDSIPGD